MHTQSPIPLATKSSYWTEEEAHNLLEARSKLSPSGGQETLTELGIRIQTVETAISLNRRSWNESRIKDGAPIR